jgi:RND superfamily putative drug exporter
MPSEMPAVKNLRWLATKFDPGALAPLTVVLDADFDLRNSTGLALIDDLSRLLARQRRIKEVRSATQPLGSPAQLSAARLSERFRAVNAGQARIEQGSRQLEDGLIAGAAKLRAALWLEERTGLPLTTTANTARPTPNPNLTQLWGGLLAGRGKSPEPTGVVRSNESARKLLQELGRAADAAGQIATGAARARREVLSILENPVGKEALDRLMITPDTVRDHPELGASFSAYITPDGHHARLDLTQVDRIYSAAAMDQVGMLRGRINDFLADSDGPPVTAQIAGENAESADIRALIRADQVQSWYVVPAGVFLVLILTLRDPVACLNLVGTMILTYAFALGATHWLFVTILGESGIDWKVPYFLFVLLVAVGVDYNVFLMGRLREESRRQELRAAIIHAVGQTGGLITSAAAITACSFASFLLSPLGSLRQLGFALVVGIGVDALVVRPLLVPCGHWLIKRSSGWRSRPVPVGAQSSRADDPTKLPAAGWS